jgi:hypothetical protein
MSPNLERLESHLFQTGLRFEPVGDRTWVMFPDTSARATIAIRLSEPIVLFTVPVLTLSPELADKEGLFRRLLSLNSELMHSSYGLEGDHVVLSAAHAVDTLDFPEVQAMIDDICMALDSHSEQLGPWFGGAAATDPPGRNS